MSQAPVSDDVLLRAFVFERDAGAFDQLARRHAGMVLGVCQAVLGNGADAEDAAQAVFLTLLTKARSLVNHPTLGGWLHHVAWHVAVRSRRTRANRARYEREAAQMNTNTAGGGSSVPADLLHEALMGLPDRYRVPLVLHHLEGYTQEEAARMLDCKVGTLSGRLTRGRQLLAGRLRKLGVTAGVAAVTGALASATASAAPAGLMSVINTMASSALAGQVAGASASAMALSKGAIHMMFMAKMKLVAMVTAAVMLVGGAGVTTYVVAAGGPSTKPAAPVQEGVRASGLRFEVLAPAVVMTPKDEKPTPVSLSLKVTNGTDAPVTLNVFDTITIHIKDAAGKELRIDGGRNGTRKVPPVVVEKGKSVTVERNAELKLLDGKPGQYRLIGSDGAGGIWYFDGLKVGTYSLAMVYENTVAGPKDAPYWIGKASTKEATVEISDKPATQPAAEVTREELIKIANEEAKKAYRKQHNMAVDAVVGDFDFPRKPTGAVYVTRVEADGDNNRVIFTISLTVAGRTTVNRTDVLLDKAAKLVGEVKFQTLKAAAPGMDG